MASRDFLKSFKLNTEAIPDKVIWRHAPTESVPLAGGLSSYTTYTYPHGLPFVPLVIGSYSDDGFTTSYDFGGGPIGSLPTYSLQGLTMIAHAYADSTNVYVCIVSHNTARTVTFHIVGLSPVLSSDTTIASPAVQDDFLLNTDLVTLKHVGLQSVPMTTDGTGNFVSVSYSTDLSTPATILCFITEGGNTSFMNTMNSITVRGVNFQVLTRADYLQLSVADTLVTDVVITLKAYADA